MLTNYASGSPNDLVPDFNKTKKQFNKKKTKINAKNKQQKNKQIAFKWVSWERVESTRS